MLNLGLQCKMKEKKNKGKNGIMSTVKNFTAQSLFWKLKKNSSFETIHKNSHPNSLILFRSILKKRVSFSKNLFSTLRYVTYVVVPHAQSPGDLNAVGRFADHRTLKKRGLNSRGRTTTILLLRDAVPPSGNRTLGSRTFASVLTSNTVNGVSKARQPLYLPAALRGPVPRITARGPS